MTIERVPEHNRPQSVTLPARAPGSALAVLALADELTAERTEHDATRRKLAGALIAGRVATYARQVYEAWALPQLGGGIPAAPDETPPVDLSVPPLIFDGLVAEFTAERDTPGIQPCRISARRRRRLLAVLVGVLFGAALVGGVLARRPR